MNNNQIHSFLESLQSGQGTENQQAKPTPSNDAEMELIRNIWSKLPLADADLDLTDNEQQCKDFQWVLKGYEAAIGRKHKNSRFLTRVTGNFFLKPKFTGILAFASITLVFAATLFMQQRQMHRYQNDMRDLKEWLVQSTYDTRPSTDRIGKIISNHQISFASLNNAPFGSASFDSLQMQENQIEALFETLKTDPSSNVRLIALQSLRNYLDQPAVRKELVLSIPFQDSDIVLLDMAEAFLENATDEELAFFWNALKTSKLESKWIRKIQSQHSTHI